MRALPAVLAALIAVPSALAQVTALQGPTKVRRFESPMILMIPFHLHPPITGTASRALWGDTEDLSNFICDGVAVYRVKYTGEDSGDGALSITFVALMAAEQGHSKVVSLSFELLREEAVIGSARLRGTYTIDKTLQPHGAVNLAGQFPNVVMTVKAADLGDAKSLGNGSSLRLRITVMVGDWTRWGAPQ